MLERRLERSGVRVVGVVDQKPSARQRRFLSTPAREPNRTRTFLRTFQRQPELAVDDERGERVKGLVPGAQSQLQLDSLSLDREDRARRLAVGLEGDHRGGAARPEAAQVDVLGKEGLEQRLAGRNDPDSTRLESEQHFGFGLGDALDRPQ